ncbi:MAG: IS66 family transposase [Bacteroidetes bacterium]|nr:IS66 family transposase [Bacteroidota bacterium]
MDTKILIETLLAKIQSQEQAINKLITKVTVLEAELAIYRNKKNSNNSHTPPSKDENRPEKNQSLREKSDKKAGGQKGHEGKTLECSAVIDEVVEHIPNYCNCCGKDLSGVPEEIIDTRQVIDIPVIKPVSVAHRIYRKKCSCGHSTESNFPAHLAAKVQYGANVEALVGYLHARQYLPYQRMKEFFTDVMGLPVSVGGINNILKRLTQKALPHYQQIKERLYQSVFIGTDETGVKVNGQKDWMWTWQNDDLTFIVHSDNRGFKTIEDNFSNGLPKATLQHDRFACHFNCEAMHHQICMAHLLRDLQYIDELYAECKWAAEMKALIAQALRLKKELTTCQYYSENEERQRLMIKLDKLLRFTLNENHSKAKTLQKNLLKHQQYILYFLYHPQVPPDNNGAERAIRNIKVKQKISGQFKSDQGAGGFAILRSVIDTTIKSGQNVLNALSLIAKLGTE